MFIDNADLPSTSSVDECARFLWLPRVMQGAAINGNGQSPEQLFAICVHMSGLVIQQRLDDRVFGLPAARVYLSLPLPFFFVLLPFFLHDDHQSNREHRRTRARFKLTRVFIAALSSGKSPEDPESSR